MGEVEVSVVYTIEKGILGHYDVPPHVGDGAGPEGLYAAFEVHPPSRLLALRVALQARTYFTRARAGILDISGGCGLFARPIASPSVQPVFGVTAWFPVYDDFETLFGRETQLPVLELSVGFAF